MKQRRTSTLHVFSGPDIISSRMTTRKRASEKSDNGKRKKTTIIEQILSQRTKGQGRQRIRSYFAEMFVVHFHVVIGHFEPYLKV